MEGRGRGALGCVAAAAVALTLCALTARADELSTLLKGGPIVRVESTDTNRFKRALCIADVEAPVDVVWRILSEPERYKEFMPRVKKMSIQNEGPAQKLVSYVLDTPFADTSYTLRTTYDPAAHTIVARHYSGDIKGSEYEWRLTSLGESLTRITYGGVTRNYSSFAQRFEDESQTITVGVNVVGLMAAVKAVKTRAEEMHRNRPAAAPPVEAAAP